MLELKLSDINIINTTIKRVVIFLFIVEAVLIAAAVVLTATADPNVEFSGLDGLLAVLGAMLVIVAMLALAVFNAVRKFIKGKYGLLDILWLTAAFLGLPLFGVYYSTIGTNRENLSKLCTIFLPFGIALSVWAFIKYLNLRKQRR